MAAPQMQLLIDDEPVAATLLDRIQRIEIRESDSEPTFAAIRLQISQQPTGTIHPLDDDVFGPGQRLAVVIGAPGGLPRRLFDGILTHIRPHFESIETNCYLEILGLDPAVLLDAAERVNSYPDYTDADVATEIFDRYHITPSVTDTDERHEADHQLLVQRATDWAFLQLLAERNGFVCYFEYDDDAGELVGHFKPRPLDSEPQADLVIRQADANLTWLDLQLVLTGPVRWSGAAIDPIRKRLVRTSDETALEPLGEDGLPDEIEQGLLDLGAEAAVRFLTRARPTDQGIRAAGRGRTDNAHFVIEARGEIDPQLYRGLLRARRPVLLRGAGSLLSGIYYVQTVRTTIDAGVIAQTFIAQRNAVGQTGQEEYGQSAEEVPAQ